MTLTRARTGRCGVAVPGGGPPSPCEGGGAGGYRGAGGGVGGAGSVLRGRAGGWVFCFVCRAPVKGQSS